MPESMSKAERERHRAARRKLTDLVNQLERCKRCKVEIGDREDVIRHLVELFDAANAEFGFTGET